MGLRATFSSLRSWLPGAVSALALLISGNAGAQSIYIANQDTAIVSVFNTATGNATTTIATGSGPLGTAVTPDGATLVIANTGGNSVSIVDTATATIRATVPVGKGPTGVAVTPNGATAYVANSNDNTVTPVDIRGLTAGTPIPVGLSPFGIAVAPNGSAVYVANSFDNTVSVISPGGNTVSATVPVGSSPNGVAVSPDSNTVYVANGAGNSVSVIAAGGNTVSATVPVGAMPIGVAVAPNGSVYVANAEDGTVSVIAAGARTATAISLGGAPFGVAVSTDGANVFVANKTSRMVSTIATTSGTVTSNIAVPGTPGSFGTFSGPAGPPASALVAAILPDSRSVAVGSPATVAATVLNTGPVPLNNCKFTLPNSAPSGLGFLYQTLNANGQLTGAANQPVSIAANGSQNFVLAFQSATPIASVQQPLVIGCNGTTPAADIVGLDLVALLFSSTPVADVVALSATSDNTGIVSAPVGGTGAFALATYNVGSAGTLTVTVDTQGIQLPLLATICQSNPSNGACLSSPSTSLSVNFATGDTPTFSVFVSPSGTIPFAPATSRIFVRFLDGNGVSHGSSSVAVRTL